VSFVNTACLFCLSFAQFDGCVCPHVPHVRSGAWLGSLYNNTAWALHELGRFAAVLATHEKSPAWRDARANNPAECVAPWCIARTLRSLGRLDEALARRREMLMTHASAWSDDGYVHEELGERPARLKRPSSRP